MSIREIFENKRDGLLEVVDADGKRTVDMGLRTPEMLDKTLTWRIAAWFAVRDGLSLAVTGAQEPAVELFTRAMAHCDYGIKALSELRNQQYAYDLWTLHVTAFVATWFLTGQEHNDHLAAAIAHQSTYAHEQEKSPFLADELAEHILVCLEVGAVETAAAAYGRIKTTISTVEAAMKGKPTTAKTLYLAILQQTDPDAVPADLLARRLEAGILTAVRSGAMDDTPHLRRIVFWLRLHARLFAPEPDPWKLMQRLMDM